MGSLGIGRIMNPIRVASRKFHSAVHWVQEERYYVLDTVPNPTEAKIPVEFKHVDRLEEGLALRLTHLTGKDGNWQRRIDLGHHCILALHEGELVGSIWICPAAWLIGNERPVGALAPDVAFVYDGFISETMRGKRLASARLAHIFHEMQRYGFKRNCTTVEDDNLASVRTVAIVGYRRTENVVRKHRWMMIFRSIEGGPPADVLP